MIFWLDFETTGLDPETDHIIEAGVAVTTDELVVVDQFHSPITLPYIDGAAFDGDWETLCRGEEAVLTMHRESGLFAELDGGSGIPVYTAQGIILDMLRRHGATPSEPIAIAGSGVDRFDRLWLAKHMPEILPLVTYWSYDLGPLRRSFRLFGTDWELTEPTPHRALGDVLRHIKELVHYRDTVQSLDGGWQRRQIGNPMLVPVGFPCPKMSSGQCGCYGPHPAHVKPEPELFTLLAETLATGKVPEEEPLMRPWALLLSAQANLTGWLAEETPSGRSAKAEQALRDLNEGLAGMKPPPEPAPDAEA